MLVLPLEVTDDALDAATRDAVAQETARAGRVTNMKRVLLRSPAAFRLFADVLPLKTSLREMIGDRAVSVFSHAISQRTGCLLCSTYFRRALIESGVSPDEFVPTEAEKDLVALGTIIAAPGHEMPADLEHRLAARYSPRTLVELVAYGAAMLATNALNTTIGVPLDADLEPFRGEAFPRP